MTEIKKATIDDVDVSRFKTQLSPRNAISPKAVVFRYFSGLYIGPHEGCCVLYRKFNRPCGDQWRAGSDAGLCGANWLPHAVAVSEEFEAWLVTELARIDREREEAAKPKMPTVKAPDGMEWVECKSGAALRDIASGTTWGICLPEEYDSGCRVFVASVALLKARAEVLGKRIVVLDEAEKCLAIAAPVWTGKEL